MFLEEKKKAAGEVVRRQRIINEEEIRINRISALQDVIDKRQ